MQKTSGSAVWIQRHSAVGLFAFIVVGTLLSAPCAVSAGDVTPVDARIRVFAYDPDEVYRLKGYVGYQIDLEFESGEAFVGLSTGDLDSVTFATQDNHLFLKPRAGTVETNLTVLTTRRAYH